MTKEFPTLSVAGVATGIVLESGGFAGIHEVLDHFYPGIMTLGCAHMAKTARKEVLRQFPGFSELGPCDGGNWQDYAARVVAKFGPTLEVEWPHGTGNPDMYDPEAESNV